MERQQVTTSVLSVRVSPEERLLLEEAASQSRSTLSDFIRRKALEAAEVEIFSRNVITIPAKDWEAFESWMARPAKATPALAELAQRTPSWEK